MIEEAKKQLLLAIANLDMERDSLKEPHHRYLEAGLELDRCVSAMSSLLVIQGTARFQRDKVIEMARAYWNANTPVE
jgi:hypothetical protein